MNCKHRRFYEFDWTNMKPCSLCEKEKLARSGAVVARQAHNLENGGANPSSATKQWGKQGPKTSG